MKKLTIISFISAFLFSCSNRQGAENVKVGEAKKASEAAGSKYLLSGIENLINWIGSNPGKQHHGTVNIISGSIGVSNNEVKSGNFVVDLNSIKNEDVVNPEMNAKLVGHLKSKDFFYTEKFPTSSFEIVEIKPLEASMESKGEVISPNSEVTGNLTIRGIIKSITFPARIDILDESVHVKTNPFSIIRTLWEVNYMSKSVIAGIKDQFIDDKIVLYFDLMFKKE